MGFGVAHAAPREKLAAKTQARIDGRIYSEPNRYGKPVSIVGRGLELKVLRYTSSRSWALVETPSLRRGWIPVQATTLGLRYSADALARRGGSSEQGSESTSGRVAGAGSRGGSRAPASDVDLENLGYSGEEYEDDAQAIAEFALREAETQAQAQTKDEESGEGESDATATDESSEIPTENGDGADIPAATYDPQDPYANANVEGAAPNDALMDELNAVDGRGRKPIRGIKTKRTDERSPKPNSAQGGFSSPLWDSTFEVAVGLEYANQITVGTTSGFGFNVGGTYKLSEHLALGLGFAFDRFSEKATNGVELVSRTANVMRIGPAAQLRFGLFDLNLLVGFTRTSTTISVTENGVSVPSDYAGSGSESTFGIRITPGVVLPIGGDMGVKLYGFYAMDFHGADAEQGDSGMPQTLGGGAALHLGF